MVATLIYIVTFIGFIVVYIHLVKYIIKQFSTAQGTGKIGWLLIVFITFSFLFTLSSNAPSKSDINNYGGGEDDYSFFSDDSCDQSDWLVSGDCGGVYDDED